MKQHIEELKTTIDQIFNHLHNNPEVSWQEFKTTEFLKSFLEGYGFSVKTFEECPGLVIEIGEGKPCIALRADMDALWQEVDGQFKAIHSCGHDAHMTMGIGAMLLLNKMGFPSNAKFKFIFQPAEEKGTGALKMIELGVLDDVDFLYGVHLRPIQELQNREASAAIYHGAAKFISGEILGEDAHGARPHLGKNAIEIGALFIQQMNNIHLDPMVPYTVKMTKFHAGSDSGNVIPGKASLSLDLRAQTNKVMNELTSKVEDIAEYLSKLHDVTITLDTKANVAAAEVSAQAQMYMEKAIKDVLGANQLRKPVITSGGEDFHFYTLKKKNIKATMLGLGCDLQPGLHHPKMTFDRNAIYSGIEILVRTILNTLGEFKGVENNEYRD